MLLAAPSTGLADPAWWSDPATTIFSGAPQDNENWAPANVGQFKHVASQARQYLELTLAQGGGAGVGVRNATKFNNSENFAPLTVGQLKSVGKAFYDRLAQIGFNWQGSGEDYWGTPTQPYPWTGTVHPENCAPANLGQVKRIFNFHLNAAFLTRDQDSDGLKDWWEKSYFNNLTTANGNTDSDADGLTNAQELSLGSNPTSSDTDADGLTDSQEVTLARNIRVPDHPAVQLVVFMRFDQ